MFVPVRSLLTVSLGILGSGDTSSLAWANIIIVGHFSEMNLTAAHAVSCVLKLWTWWLYIVLPRHRISFN